MTSPVETVGEKWVAHVGRTPLNSESSYMRQGVHRPHPMRMKHMEAKPSDVLHSLDRQLCVTSRCKSRPMATDEPGGVGSLSWGFNSVSEGGHTPYLHGRCAWSWRCREPFSEGVQRVVTSSRGSGDAVGC